MTKKIRDLIKELKKAGFHERRGKGSHRNFIHESRVVITLSGKPGDDAKPYQEKSVKQKIKEAANERKR